MRLIRFAQVIQLDESGALSGNGTSDKHGAGSDEMRPFKSSLNRGSLQKTPKAYISVAVIASAVGRTNAAPFPGTPSLSSRV